MTLKAANINSVVEQHEAFLEVSSVLGHLVCRVTALAERVQCLIEDAASRDEGDVYNAARCSGDLTGISQRDITAEVGSDAVPLMNICL